MSVGVITELMQEVNQLKAELTKLKGRIQKTKILFAIQAIYLGYLTDQKYGPVQGPNRRTFEKPHL